MKKVGYKELAIFTLACSVLIALVLTVFFPKSAFADDATTTCKTMYGNSQDEQAACVDGFNNGTGTGSLCIGYREKENGQKLESACREGWNSYKGGADSCRETYTNSGGGRVDADEEKIQECLDGLRPNSSDSSSTDSTSDNPSSLASNAIGKEPTDAKITDRQNDEKTEQHECGIEGFFGKITCGITLFFAKITDTSFHMLTAFLKTPPVTTTNANNQASAMYTAWSLFRGLANILFVIAMIIVLYSHLTSVGVSNYNLKRMLPRLIIASLLVNLSFYICAIFVDISNILGATLKDTIVDSFTGAISADGKLVKSGYGTWEEASSSVLLITAGAALAGAALLYASLSVLIPILTSALVAIVTTVFVLMLRQVLIILFIIISPLAFASIILPNTASWFDKWKSYFVPIVMLFPALALIYAGSYVASISIQRTAAANGDTILTIMSLGIQVIPLFLTPIIMKLGGGLLNRFGGIVNTPGKKIKDKANNYADTLNKRRDLKALNYNPSVLGKARLLKRARVGAIRSKLGREQRNNAIDNNLEAARNQDVYNRMNNEDGTFLGQIGIRKGQSVGDKFQQQVAQSSDKQALANAKNHVITKKVKAHAEAVEAKSIEDKNMTRDQSIAAATAEAGVVSELTKEAAILRICQAGDIGAILQLVKASYNMTDQQRQTLVAQIRKSGVGEKVPFLANQEALDHIEQGRVNDQTFASHVVVPSVAQDDYSADTYADIDQDAATEVAQVLGQAMNGDQATLMALGKASQGAGDGKVSLDRNVGQAQIKKGAELLREHEQAAYDALTNTDTAIRVAQNRKDLVRIADKHLAHEEAEMLNSLYDAQNRGDE